MMPFSNKKVCAVRMIRARFADLDIVTHEVQDTHQAYVAVG